MLRAIKKQSTKDRAMHSRTLRHMMAPAILFLAALSPFLFLAGCKDKPNAQSAPQLPRLPRALDNIRNRGVLIVGTLTDAHCYYNYHGREMGFEYELAKAFAESLDVKLQIRVGDSWPQLASWLEAGTCDVVAAGVTITPARLQQADFAGKYLPVQQVLIGRKTNQKRNKFDSVDDLKGKTVQVEAQTAYMETMQLLKNGGLDVNVVSRDDVSTEELIEEVAKGTVGFTIADSNIALLNLRYFPGIRILFPVRDPLTHGWAVKKGEAPLAKNIDLFFNRVHDQGTLKKIYTQYYAYVEKYDELDINGFKQLARQRLPAYEKMIRDASKKHRFDWRLVAALIYQESKFLPDAVNFSGVEGLLQMTEEAAGEVGIEDRLDPRQSIYGGTRYLRNIHDSFQDTQEPDRTLMALAAYNVGIGHVLDAQQLAKTKGMDPSKWTSIEKTLPLLRLTKYHKNSRHGYCRGFEPVLLVQRVLAYYEILKRDAIEYTG